MASNPPKEGFKLRNEPPEAQPESLQGVAAQGLLFTSDLDPGIRRVRRGGGFLYFHPDGKRVGDGVHGTWCRTCTKRVCRASGFWRRCGNCLLVTSSAVQRELRKVIAAVAARLGNTPAISRKCYIHPEVLLAYAQGRLVEVVGKTTARALNSLLRKRGRNT
jgi:DNA topoisomerase IB